MKNTILFCGKEFDVTETEDFYTVADEDLYVSKKVYPFELVMAEFRAMIREKYLDTLIDPSCQVSVSAEQAAKFSIEKRLEIDVKDKYEDSLYETYVGILDDKYELFINPFKD